MATVELAAQLQDKGVVGVALTGAQLFFALDGLSACVAERNCGCGPQKCADAAVRSVCGLECCLHGASRGPELLPNVALVSLPQSTYL